MTVICRTHGPMKYRFALKWHECPGFDGEGCGTQVVCDEDLARGTASGIPNVEVRPLKCMPWPLAVLCWLDNRKGPHSESSGLACHVHDAAMRFWWKRFPGSEARFNRVSAIPNTEVRP